jgi:intracellular septation protein
MREFFNDLLSTLFFLSIYWISGNIYAATAIAIAVGLAQIGYCNVLGRKIDPMQWLSLGLVVVFGGATLATRDPRFVMIKPTIIHFALAAVMLRRGWMKRYLPPIVTDNVSQGVIAGSGYAWAALMVFLGAANLIIALTFDVRVWAWFISFGAIGAKLVFLALSYGLFRTLVVRHRRAMRDQHPPQSLVATRKGDQLGSLQKTFIIVLTVLAVAASGAIAGEAVSYAPVGPVATPGEAVPGSIPAALQ